MANTRDNRIEVNAAARRHGIASPRLAPATSGWLADASICAVALVVFIGYCLFKSPRRLFWTDEILTAVAVKNASFGEMIDSLRDTINAVPPNYFVGLWLWTKAFGASDVALRAFSALAMGLGWIFCWLLLRRFSSRLTAFTAATTAIVCSQEIMDYDVDARCYAQYAAAFFAAGLMLVVCAGRTGRAGWKALAATAAGHAMLVTTHYVGCVYSAALIVAALVAGRVARQRALQQYALAAAVGAASFAACIPFYLAQRTLGTALDGPRRPKFHQLISSYDFEFQPELFVILILIAGYALTCRYLALQRPDSADSGPSTPTADRWPAPAMTMLGVFTLFATAALVPIGLWVESLVRLPLFLHRYLLPSFIVWPIALALALEPLHAFMIR